MSMLRLLDDYAAHEHDRARGELTTAHRDRINPLAVGGGAGSSLPPQLSCLAPHPVRAT